MYFTTLRVEKGIPLFFKSHLEHFVTALEKAHVAVCPFPMKACLQFLEKQCVFNQTSRLNLFYSADQKWSFQIKNEAPREKKGVDLALFPFPFFEEKPFIKKAPFKRKELMTQAHKKHFDDWIFYTLEESILETAIANICWIKEKTLYYPDPSLPYYLGVTLKRVLQGAQDLNLKLCPCKARAEELLKADEVLYSNSMKGVHPVLKIDHHQLIRRSNFLEKIDTILKKREKEESDLWQKHQIHLHSETLCRPL